MNARRSAATLVGQFSPIGFATGARVLPVTSCSKSTTILPVERVGGVLCRPRRCGKRASTPVHSAASVSCAFSIPPARSIGRPRRDWRRAGPGLASLRGCRPALGCSCRLRRAGLRGAVRPSHRATLQLDTVCVVEQAAWDGVGLVGVADDGVPVVDGEQVDDLSETRASGCQVERETGQ